MQRLARCRPCRGTGRVKNWAGRYVPCSPCRGTGTVLVGGLGGLGAHGEGWHLVKPTEEIAEALWPLVEQSYAEIGNPLKSPADLFDQPLWFIFGDPLAPLAFQAAKVTEYGRKFTLAGSNGSPEGRAAAREAAVTRFDTTGNYAEVSHRPEALALKANSPVVCAADAAKVLGKSITVEPDGVHYKRHITNVGIVTKVMVGRPKLVPIQPFQTARCKAPLGGCALGGLGAMREDSDPDSLLMHVTSLAGF